MAKSLIVNILLVLCLGGNSFRLRAGNNSPISLFSSGRWVKASTSSAGIHKISYSWLSGQGFKHPENVRIFAVSNQPVSVSQDNFLANVPVQIPVTRYTEPSGSLALLFFVPGSLSWNWMPAAGSYLPVQNRFARGRSFLFLTEDNGIDLTVRAADPVSNTPDAGVTSGDGLFMVGEENLNLIESGSRWFDTELSPGQIVSKSLTMPNRLENEPVILQVVAAGRGANRTSMPVKVNGSPAGTLNFGPVDLAAGYDFATLDSISAAATVAGKDLTVSFGFNGGQSERGYLDQAVIRVRQNLVFEGNALFIRDSRSIRKGGVAEYRVGSSSGDLRLWDVTNSQSPASIPVAFIAGQVTFRTTCDSLRTFILFDPKTSLPGLEVTGEIVSSGLMDLAVPDMVILAPGAFLSPANRLADYHRSADGLSVQVVPVESVYNEFAGGYPDPGAIRNYAGFLYNKGNGIGKQGLKYLLLFGKGTCDPVHPTGEENPNWIPSVQSENSLSRVSSFVTDDYFGFIDPANGGSKGATSIGIGRIPAATPAEADATVEKIIRYHDAATFGDWQNNLAFIADDGDNGLHMNDSERLSDQLESAHPASAVSKIYLDAYPQVFAPEKRFPAAASAIRQSVHKGNLVVNYIGHANEDGLAHERVLTIPDINGWTNKNRLPLFVTATCEFSRWDMVQKRSAGETLLFHPAGGAIALLSATRLVYSASNFEINQSLVRHLYDRDEQGNFLRLGDLVRIIKNENSGSVNTLKFCLLGDPALRLNYAEYLCRTTSINQQIPGQQPVSLTPGKLVNLSGEVADASGQSVMQVDGLLDISILDQETLRETLGNTGNQPFPYFVRDNVLFHGKTAVKGGKFSFSFVVPEDVSYGDKTGLIRYYFQNDHNDGSGAFQAVRFGGDVLPASADHTGPVIRPYLENENFTDGSAVSANPLLVVRLSDESGINTSSAGIGHDMTAILDGNSATPYILNDFYESDPGSWTSGTVNFLLTNLSTGTHTLRLRVWDNVNNSAFVTINFIVENNFLINKVTSYPNPFSEHAFFLINHNRYNEMFDAHLEIFDLTGRQLDSVHQQVVSEGYWIRELAWTPGSLLPSSGNRNLVYRITLTDLEGRKSTFAGRMVRRP